MKFERDEGSFEISLCVCSIRVFTKFSGDPYYEPLAWFMIMKHFLKVSQKILKVICRRLHCTCTSVQFNVNR